MERLLTDDKLNNNQGRQLKELRVLAELNQEIHSTMNMNRLLQILVEKAVVGVNFERCLIYLLEDDYLRCAAWIDRIKRDRASIIQKKVGFRMDENSIEVLSIKMCKPFYITNARKDRRVSPKILRISDTTEYCVLPMIGRNKVLGVFTGDKPYSGETIRPEDIETLKLFVGHISLAIENAKLYQEKEEFNQILEKSVYERTSELSESNRKLSVKNDELSTLYQMGKSLNTSLEKEAVFGQVFNMIKSLGYNTFSIRTFDENRVSIITSLGLDDEYKNLASRFLYNQEEYRQFGDEPKPFLVNNLDSQILPQALRDYYIKNRFRSSLEVPIIVKGVIIASIRFYSQKTSFFDDKTHFFFLFGQQIGIALENAMTFQNIVKENKQIATFSKKIEMENVYLKENNRREFVIGKSRKMNNVMKLVEDVAQTCSTVIIYGETGTGKELIARAIHDVSPRSNDPLINLNCAAIPEDLIESELFGHEKGSFTGAHQRRIGMFELAQGGTLFLDEIGELSFKTQTKLLRVLQEQELRRIGSRTPISLDVRIIAATNRDLARSVKEASFRSDLYYRLNVFPITLPPLRERKEDISELMSFFLKKYNKATNQPIFSEEVKDLFYSYSWPGNIRELENVIERLCIISKGGHIVKSDLPMELQSRSDDGYQDKPMAEAVTDFKREMILGALRETGGKKSHAAALLGLHSSNFSRLLKSLQIKQNV